MHYNVLASLAFALAATASPCKPSTSSAVSSSSSQPSTSVTINSSTSLETSETSTLSVTASTDPSSSQPQPTSLSETDSVSTSATSTAASITSSATSDVTTSSTIAPTSTSSPVLGTFNAMGQGGGASGTPARLPPPDRGSITLGGYNPSGVPPGVFSIEAGTGALFIDGSKICGFYSGSESASLYVCHATPQTNEAPVTCDQGQKDGDFLKCSAPSMNCIEDFNDDNDPVCYPTGGVWSKFMGFQFLGNYFLLSIGSVAAASTQGFIPIELTIQAL